MGQEVKLGRQPFFHGEIDQEICSLTYGTLPCTASGAAGEECYNTFLTCQDRVNFASSIQTFKFSTERIAPPLGESMFPCVVGNPNITPARLDIENGIGQRGAISIKVRDFPHDDTGVDKYLSTRPTSPAGNFFNKLRRRNPFYQNRAFRLVSGYLSGGAVVDATTRAYLMDTFEGPDKNGLFIITAKDILKLTDDASALCPKELDAAIPLGLNSSAVNVILRTGDGAKVAAAIAPMTSGTIRIEDEIITFGVINVDTLQSCSRGTWGTTAAAHAVDKKVTLVKAWTSTNVVDILDELLQVFAGVDSAYINATEWTDEKNTWLLSNNLTRLVPEPRKVSELIKELCIQNSISIWYNELESLVKISASSLSLGNEIPAAINDHNNILMDSLSLVEDKDTRLSQIWIFYDPISYLEGETDPDNFQDWKIAINPDFEDDAAYGEPRIKRVYALWLNAANAGIVTTMASRLLTKDLAQRFKLSFALDAKDAALWTGQFLLIDHHDITGLDGLPETQKVQVTQVTETETGHRFEYKARANPFDRAQRFIFIASNSLVDYATATDTEKAENWFISDGDQPFPDGGAAYSITG